MLGFKDLNVTFLSGFSGSKLTQLLKSVMDKTAYLTFLGHVSPTAKR